MKIKRYKYYSLLAPFAMLLLIAVVLIIKNRGVFYEITNTAPSVLTAADQSTPAVSETPRCLVLADETQQSNNQVSEQMLPVLDSMKIAYDLVDVEHFSIDSLGQYQNVVIMCSDLSPLQTQALDLLDWVQTGGRVMFAATLEPNSLLQGIKAKLGVYEGGSAYYALESFTFESDFMIAGKDKIFTIDEPYDSALSLTLDDTCKVHMISGDDRSIPLIWERPYGEGKIVVNNHGLFVKASRGLLAAAYSLLDDICVYPVINASSFYIDDFPSPIPSGDNEYITRDYNVSLNNFYRNIWWPQMLELGERYGLKYTGVIIESYSDDTTAPYSRNIDTADYKFFGGMLLNTGGELGYHGYNHIPFSLDNADYARYSINYVTFQNQDNMIASLRELVEFVSEVFPDVTATTYVPPSNILSAEGRVMIKNYFPEIKVIASVYLSTDLAYEQEFEVGGDGIIEFPRVISGYDVDNYMEMGVLSELNLHYVNSHFIHPDDVLDPDRGAEAGWESLRQSFDEYLSWLYQSAPGIRDLTATDGALAVKQFDQLSLERTLSETELTLKLGGFDDCAYLMMRLNEGSFGEVQGGTLEHLTGDLYLLHAEAAEIHIKLDNQRIRYAIPVKCALSQRRPK